MAEDLGIHPGTLHSWVSRARRNGSSSSDRPVADPSPGSRLRESERAELERLRAEAGDRVRVRRVFKELLSFRRLWGGAPMSFVNAWGHPPRKRTSP
ncbi:hypothetical protein ACWEQO_24965 [Streptomyces sp. NPDC004051]